MNAPTQGNCAVGDTLQKNYKNNLLFQIETISPKNSIRTPPINKSPIVTTAALINCPRNFPSLAIIYMYVRD
jgi:hypothetical protein